MRVCVSLFREYAQSKRDGALSLDSTRFALNNLEKEKEDIERQRDEYKLRFSVVYPHTNMFGLTTIGGAGGMGGGTSGFMNTHTGVSSHDTPVHHAASIGSGSSSSFDVDAAAAAAQKQLADLRARNAQS